MKNIITAIALSVATATTASANICNVNPDAIIDYPGYHGTQNVWYDKGEYLFMFNAESHHADPISYKHYSNVESIVTHTRMYKDDCRVTDIEVVITENKERFEEVVIVEELTADELTKVKNIWKSTMGPDIRIIYKLHTNADGTVTKDIQRVVTRLNASIRLVDVTNFVKGTNKYGMQNLVNNKWVKAGWTNTNIIQRIDPTDTYTTFTQVK